MLPGHGYQHCTILGAQRDRHEESGVLNFCSPSVDLLHRGRDANVVGVAIWRSASDDARVTEKLIWTSQSAKSLASGPSACLPLYNVHGLGRAAG